MIPLSLYIHFPWCVKKCPYCDFNSHSLQGPLPETEYITALLTNLDQTLDFSEGRPLQSIFMGGGTPSLFSAPAIEKLLKGVAQRLPFTDNIEITLEANPGTVEQTRFNAYRAMGITRLSLGIQSFNDRHLKALGRIHGGKEAEHAIETVQKAGFTQFNLDLMFGLPQQTLDEGLQDLQKALSHQPPHLSWYELTLEPNTAFWHAPPPLPVEETTDALLTKGQALLKAAGFNQYEVSAYTRGNPCQHNLNYWQFGDYLAIGAGSHAKITQTATSPFRILRYHHFRHPKQYLQAKSSFIQEQRVVTEKELPFEYLLNVLRLKEGVPLANFSQRTGLSLTLLLPKLELAVQKGWLLPLSSQKLTTTALGYRFLNDVLNLFLEDPSEASC